MESPIQNILQIGKKLGLNKFKSIRFATDKTKYFLANTPLPFSMKVDGIRISGMTIKDYILGLYEPHTTSLFRHITKPGFTVLDIGADVGFFTVLFSQLVGPAGRVIALEPFKKTYSILLKNIKGLHNVEALNIAADEVNGEKSFHPDTHSLYYEKNDKGMLVQTVKLDDYFPNLKVDIVKIDVEGGEGGVLRGMESILHNNSDIQVIIEIAPRIMNNIGLKPEDLLKKLTDFGFHLHIIDKEIREATFAEIISKANAEININILCCRKPMK